MNSAFSACHIANIYNAITTIYYKVNLDTHSLLFCAAFHGIVNYSKRDQFSDTRFTVAFIGVIVFWIVMWYYYKEIYKIRKQ